MIIINKTGFIVKVRARNKEYFYLRKSERINGIKRDSNIFSFGTKEKAIPNLLMWQEKSDLFPSELKKLGYDTGEIGGWIAAIESK